MHCICAELASFCLPIKQLKVRASLLQSGQNCFLLSHSLLKPLETDAEDGCCCFNRRARKQIIKTSEKIVKDPSPHGITLSLVVRKLTDK